MPKIIIIIIIIMRTRLDRIILALSLIFTLSLVSCDIDFWQSDDMIVGKWGYYFEDRDGVEEEIYTFTASGEWIYSYEYMTSSGYYVNEVDGGTYSIVHGKLRLYSVFSNDTYIYNLTVTGNRLILSDIRDRWEYERW